MFRRLDVRLVVLVTVVLVVAIGMTLFLIWWIDAQTVSTVTPNATGDGFNVTEETLSVGQILVRRWPILLLGVGGPALLVLVPFIVRAVRPVRRLAEDTRKLAASSVNEPVSDVADDDIRSLSRSIDTLAARLAHTDKLRRNMVNDVAHELRSPLTNIQCQLEAIQDGLMHPDEDTIRSLYEETMLLKRLTDDLQDLALAEAGQLPLTFGPLNIAGLIHAVVRAMQPQFSAARQAVSLELETLPLIEADEKRLQQVLRNLLSNAIRHTPPGGRIVISTRTTDAGMLIRVQDSGPGLPEDALTDIFERFYRPDPSRTRQTGGAGLGLAIVKQIVEAHHGRVWAENGAKGGAVFSVLLPSKLQHGKPG